MNDVKKTIPIREGLWSEASSHLLGHKCSSCGEIFFPGKNNGICTNCRSTDLEEIELNSRGKIHTCTVVMLRPPGGYYRGDVPYSIGWVELEEGVLVETLFTGCDPEEVHVGMDVELTFEKLHDDEESNEVITYKFQPVSS
ncbi:Zn-ribbon domain-containing OB-fold protein [Thermodesulfobacteriota bacterium]